MKTILTTILILASSLLGFSTESVPNCTCNNDSSIDSTYRTLNSVIDAKTIELILTNLNYSGLLYENGIQGIVKLKCKMSSGVFHTIEVVESDHPQLIYECIEALNSCNKIPYPTCSEETYLITFNFNSLIETDKKFENGNFYIFKKSKNDH